MKKNVLYNLFFLPIALLIVTGGMSQITYADDQNPNYMVSQAKYMKMADSINTWHGTTPQETYKAVDYLADRREARQQRRLNRIRYGGGWRYGYNDYYYNSYYPVYSGYYNNYYPGYGYYRPYRYGSRWNNRHYWNTVPAALSLAWWLCR